MVTLLDVELRAEGPSAKNQEMVLCLMAILAIRARMGKNRVDFTGWKRVVWRLLSIQAKIWRAINNGG